MTVLAFAFGNIWSWGRHVVDPECCDVESTIGFPFPYYIAGGITGQTDFYILGLLLDIAIALTLAVLLTRIAAVFHAADD